AQASFHVSLDLRGLFDADQRSPSEWPDYLPGPGHRRRLDLQRYLFGPARHRGKTTWARPALSGPQSRDVSARLGELPFGTTEPGPPCANARRLYRAPTEIQCPCGRFDRVCGGHQGVPCPRAHLPALPPLLDGSDYSGGDANLSIGHRADSISWIQPRQAGPATVDFWDAG